MTAVRIGLAAPRGLDGDCESGVPNQRFVQQSRHEPVRKTRLMAAARSEYAKLERPLTAAGLGV
jgi:hypothetical protein